MGNGLYNEYLFIKSDKILGKALKQVWDNGNTHWKVVRYKYISLCVGAPMTVLNDICLDKSFLANTHPWQQQETKGPEDLSQFL